MLTCYVLNIGIFLISAMIMSEFLNTVNIGIFLISAMIMSEFLNTVKLTPDLLQ